MLFSKMKKIFVASLIMIIANTGFAQVKNTVTRSAITFQIKNVGIGTGGTIGGLHAEFQFSTANLAASTMEASVDVNTINTYNSSSDEHLKSEDFFDVQRYPKITLKSVSFKHKSGNNYTGQYNLTIKNKTKLVEIPFSLIEKGNSTAFKGSFKINRLDFGVGTDSFTLSNDVTIMIDTEVSDQ